MSTIRVNTINDANGGSNAVLYGVAAPANSMGFRNRIINGDMRIDQRNAGAAVTAANQYTLDRWIAFSSAASKYTVQQGTTNLPTGFSNALNTVSSGAYSVLSSDFFMLTHRIEGLNISDLGWGTSAAQSVTLSFWVYSSLAGNFGGAVVNNAQTRSYPFLYNIPTANTPTKITITIPGDTTGTWLTTNGIGMGINFGLGVGTTYSGTAGAWAAATYYSATGAVSVVGTSGAIFNITGVQLEAGSVASPFERRDYGRELMMCQRYYYKIFPQAILSNLGLAGFASATTSAPFTLTFPSPMRTPPIALEVSGTASNYSILSAAGNTNCSTVPTHGGGTNEFSASLNFTVASGLTTGQGVIGRTGGTTGASGYLAWSAEL